MRLPYFAVCLALCTHTVHAFTGTSPMSPRIHAPELPQADPANIRRSNIFAPENALERRKGGGGGGGGKGGGSSGGSSSSGGKSGGSSSSTSSSSRSGSSSSLGGSTKAGSGPSRSYGGGYYGGGASVPYKSGGKSNKGLVAGAALGVGTAGVLMPGIWLYSVYPYAFHNPYRFVNESIKNQTNPNGFNQSLPVTCLCQDFSPCGCDENDDQKYLKDLVGNGSYAALNKSLVTVTNDTGTLKLVLNGTLPNGTTAPGGVDDAAMALSIAHYGGYWVMGLIVLYTVFI